MARITVEDCLEKENNRFALVQLAARRTKQILAGAAVLAEDKSNKAVVTALREIAEGHVEFLTAEEEARYRDEQAQLRVESRDDDMALLERLNTTVVPFRTPPPLSFSGEGSSALDASEKELMDDDDDDLDDEDDDGEDKKPADSDTEEQ